MGSFWHMFLSITWFLCQKRGFKKCFKKRCPSRLKQDPIRRQGGSRRGSLTCALYRQETVVWAAVEALFEHLAEKSEMDSKWVQKNWLNCWIVATETDWVAENCWLLKTEANVETESVETIAETNARGPWADTPWAKARRISSGSLSLSLFQSLDTS